jgi:cobyrinic acid a,c-diamide synthase
MSQRSLPAFVIAGTHSGVGKTTVALAIMAALRRRGLKVAPFKVGPDFIDAGLHAAAAGAPARNLDGWMLPRDTNVSCWRKNVRGKDAAIVEGMMGLYDGHSGRGEAGSTAEMAKWLGLPVVLVADAAALARSAAALCLGYRNFDRGVDLAGVIFNRVGGAGHAALLRDALASTTLGCFGALPLDARIQIPERHLGLATAAEDVLTPRVLERLARWAETHLDLDVLLATARVRVQAPAAQRAAAPGGVTIAVARDRAFSFYYADNLDALRAAGARLKFFSPIAGHALPAGTSGIYFGGGYPELYARELARNGPMRRAVRDFVEAGGPVYAECGGLMYLSQALIDVKGRRHAMAGVYPFATRMHPALRMIGYREVVFRRGGFLPAGESARGHEFHYSGLVKPASKIIPRAYARAAREECSGYMHKNCLASYVHLHFGSNPGFARRFVAACEGA